MRTEHRSVNREVRILERDDRRYPALLSMTGKSAPPRLYCIGNLSLLRRKAAAVVGARKATPYGKWVSYHIGRKLGQYGIVTVSGMAYGCDAEAHRGALSVGGATIAVLGSGVSVCYPKRNQPLYEEILAKDGLILSEQKPDAVPLPAFFAERNRIISGLSLVVVVTEAGLSSGSLITAEYAAEQGRTVMAVPGNMNSLSSIGCNKLIQDGASIVTGLGDILEELGIQADPDDESKMMELSQRERDIFNLIRNSGEVSLNLISRETGLSIAGVNAVAAQLEIRGFIVSSMGKAFVAKPV